MKTRKNNISALDASPGLSSFTAPESAKPENQTIMGSATATIETNHDFIMDPGLLISVIRSQAGSLDKALLEGVMNSIDAGATRVDITIDPLEIRITDDGKGFTDKTEIEDFFKTFGKPHTEGDAIYGKFRMGRGQMFSFGINEWRTGTFQMNVDINTRIGFSLIENLKDEPGCDITIALYEPLSQSDIFACKREIARMVKYTPAPVYVNGDCVTETIDPKQFNKSTEDAWIKTSSAQYGLLSVYNLGVFVCAIPSHRYGVSGTIVSRQQLSVNFARNEILVNKCEVWKRIKPIIDEAGVQTVRRKLTLNEGEKANVITRLVSKTMRPYEADGMKFLTDVSGKAWSPKAIRSARFEAYSVAERGSNKGDKLLQQGKALVLDADCVAQFECEVSQLFKLYHWDKMPAYATMDVLTSTMCETGAILPKAKWKDIEKAWVSVIRKMQTAMPSYEFDPVTHKYVSTGMYGRRIDVGTSDVANGWTDGSTYIAFAREFLRGEKMFIKGAPVMKSFINVATLLIHELCHDTDSRENVHSEEFYREFHDQIRKRLGWMVTIAMNDMTPAKYKNIVGGLEEEPESDEAPNMPEVA